MTTSHNTNDVPEFIVMLHNRNQDVLSADNDADLERVLTTVIPGEAHNATVYKLDGDVRFERGEVEYFPLAFPREIRKS